MRFSILTQRIIQGGEPRAYIWGGLEMSYAVSGPPVSGKQAMRLLGASTEASVLSPSIAREIVCRLLVEAEGERLRCFAVLVGHRHRIARAVTRLHGDFATRRPGRRALRKGLA